MQEAALDLWGTSANSTKNKHIHTHIRTLIKAVTKLSRRECLQGAPLHETVICKFVNHFVASGKLVWGKCVDNNNNDRRQKCICCCMKCNLFPKSSNNYKNNRQQNKSLCAFDSPFRLSGSNDRLCRQMPSGKLNCNAEIFVCVCVCLQKSE